MKLNLSRRRHILIALLFILPLTRVTGQSITRAKENVVLPLDPTVRTGKLANGFSYFIRHNEQPKNRVLMYLVNKVGSILEDEDQRGLAHFMEHMSFNGTKNFPKNSLVDYLQRSGVRFGADLNAYTAFDETVYQLPIASDNPELLKSGIDIMRDWAQEATLDPVEINKERGVVLEEKRLGKGAGERMQRLITPVLLNNSRYAIRLPIGLDTVLDNFKARTITRFYKDWYRPDLQALIIVGDIDVDKIEKIIKEKFASLKNPVHERTRISYTVPLTGKNQFLAVTDKEMTSTVAQIIIKHQARPVRTEADYRVAIEHDLFNEMLGARYAELTRQPNPPFFGGSASISALLANLDSYTASAQVIPGQMEKGVKALWRETIRLKRFGFTQTELDRAKADYLSQIETILKEKGKTNSGSFVNEYQAYFLKGTAAPGIDMEFRLTKNDLSGISLSELNGLTSEYIRPTNRDIVITAPDKDKNLLPSELSTKKWLNEVEQENLSPYKDLMISGTLLNRPPVAGNIISRSFDKQLNLLTLRFSNGVKVLLKPTDFKNDEILFSGFAPGGTSLYSDADYQSAANAGGLIAAGGVGNFNPDQLLRYLQGKEVSVTPYINERFEGFTGGAVTKDIGTALQLVYAYFTEPRKDTTIFNSVIARSKVSLLNRSNDPGSVFSDTVSAVLGRNNFRRTGPTLEKLKMLNIDKAYNIYKDRFSNASDFTFTFVGSIDTNTLIPLLKKYVGSLTFSNNHSTSVDLHINPPEGKIEKTVLKGSEPKSTVLLVFSGVYDFTPENNTRMNALKEALQIRLIQRLREDESGVYAPSVSVNTSKYPEPRYSIVVRFGCAPQNVEKLIASTQNEIQKLRDAGPPAENIDKWRAEERTTSETAVRTNGFWLEYINSQLMNAEALNQIFSYGKLLDTVTPADVKAVANKYLSGANYIRLVLSPDNSRNN